MNHHGWWWRQALRSLAASMDDQNPLMRALASFLRGIANKGGKH